MFNKKSPCTIKILNNNKLRKDIEENNKNYTRNTFYKEKRFFSL